MNADEFFSPANRKQPTPKLSPADERELLAIAALGIEVEEVEEIELEEQC